MLPPPDAVVDSPGDAGTERDATGVPGCGTDEAAMAPGDMWVRGVAAPETGTECAAWDDDGCCCCG